MPQLVIIPTYDEEANIEPLIAGISEAVPDIHLVFVDDNSRDQTRALIRAAIKEHAPGKINLLERPGKMGLGTAYVDGFRWALERDYDVIIEMDADLSHRPVDLAELARLSHEYPVVVGSRYVPDGGTLNWGVGRQMISRLGSLYARIILGMKTRDLTGGFNAWQRRVLEAIDLDSIKSEGYTFQIELKYRAHQAGFPIKEQPIIFVERRAGQSKMSGGIVWEAIHRVWRLASQNRQQRRSQRG